MRNAVRRARIAVAIPLVVTSFGAIVAPALGDGTSPSTNGCYAKWWHTAFAGYCEPATVDGYYRIFADCKWPQIRDVAGPWRYIAKGSTIKPFDSQECNRGIHYARVEFKG